MILFVFYSAIRLNYWIECHEISHIKKKFRINNRNPFFPKKNSKSFIFILYSNKKPINILLKKFKSKRDKAYKRNSTNANSTNVKRSFIIYLTVNPFKRKKTCFLQESKVLLWLKQRHCLLKALSSYHNIFKYQPNTFT